MKDPYLGDQKLEEVLLEDILVQICELTVIQRHVSLSSRTDVYMNVYLPLPCHFYLRVPEESRSLSDSAVAQAHLT